MSSPVTVYQYLFRDLADNRVKNWLFMSGPESVLSITIAYVVALKVGKALMENRKPFQLKSALFLYNVFQIVANTLLVFEFLDLGWMRDYQFGCQPPDYSNSPKARKMLSIVYWAFCLKMFDTVETFFFVLRKKFNQVSFLHVYHHIGTIFLSWVICKYAGGGLPTFNFLLNCFVHVLMYTYYLLSSLGPEWQSRISKWKPRLTRLQLVQFLIIMVQASLGLREQCQFPPFLIHLNNAFMISMLYMFGSFYKKSYLKKLQGQ